MLNEDNKSIIITIPQKRSFSNKLYVVPNKQQNRVTKKYGRNLSEDDLQEYTLPDEEIISITKLKHPEALLPFRQYSKRQDTARLKRKLAIKVHEKYKIVSSDLQRRLQVDEPINDVNSVLDVDEDYYTHVNGRPLWRGTPNFKSIKVCINKILKLRQESGVVKDCLLNIETIYRNELGIYNLTVKRLTDQAKYFDAFISEDYRKSMQFLEKWDKLKCQVDLKIKELQNSAIENFTIKSKLIGLEYKYGLQQKYGRFLYYLSPPSWRLNNRDFARSVEIEAKGFDLGNSHEDTFAVVFEKLRNICYNTPIRPALFFTQPKDLIDIFSAMENQQLHYYTHVNNLTPYTKILKGEIKSLKDVIFQDYASIANSIKVYENYLKFCEDRCAHLEVKFFKILFGLFYNSVAEPDVLKLTLHLEFCYVLFLEKPTNVDIIVMATSIEKQYMDYTKLLDEIRNNTVRRAMRKCVETERLKMKRAKNAAKELRWFHRLERELLNAYGTNIDNIFTPLNTNTDTRKNHLDSSQTNGKSK